MNHPRVLSLLASATEIVCALGLGDCLVGRSHECDNPPWVTRLPALSQPAFDTTVSSREIDREVNRRIRAGEPLYNLDVSRIESLQPDLILAQEHCDVCAVTPGDLARSGCARHPAPVLALTAGTLDGIFAGIERVALALGVPEAGHDLVEQQKTRLANLRQRTAGYTTPTVVVLEWTDPIFALGNWGPELVDAANGQILLGHRGQHSRAIDWKLVRDADPDVLVVAPCGYDLPRAERELPTLTQYPGWANLRAVHNHRVAFADGNRFFNRSGMTVVRTAEILAEILHGEVTDEPTEGIHWLNLEEIDGQN